MEPIANIVNSIKLLKIFAKRLVDIYHGFKYTVEYVQDIFDKKEKISLKFHLFINVFGMWINFLGQNFVQTKLK